ARRRGGHVPDARQPGARSAGVFGADIRAGGRVPGGAVADRPARRRGARARARRLLRPARAVAARAGRTRRGAGAAHMTPDERRAVGWSFAYNFALLAGWDVIRPIRGAIAGEFGISKCKWLFLITLGAMLVVVPLYSWLVARVPRARLIPIVYRFFVLNLLAFYLLWRFGVARGATGRVFYVWTAVYNVF